MWGWVACGVGVVWCSWPEKPGYRQSRGIESQHALASIEVLPESPYKQGLAALARFAVEHTT